LEFRTFSLSEKRDESFFEKKIYAKKIVRNFIQVKNEFFEPEQVGNFTHILVPNFIQKVFHHPIHKFSKDFLLRIPS